MKKLCGVERLDTGRGRRAQVFGSSPSASSLGVPIIENMGGKGRGEEGKGKGKEEEERREGKDS